MSNFDLLEGARVVNANKLGAKIEGGHWEASIRVVQDPAQTDVAAVRDQLLAAIELAQAMQWRDIESAPKDHHMHGNGLLLLDCYGVTEGYWSGKSWRVGRKDITPTHWMPLPPVQEGE